MEGPSSHSAVERGIAFHEAGHVVVGTRLGLQVLDSDLEPDDQGGRGHTHFAPPDSWFQPAHGHLSERERDFVERVVTTFMAGYAAEARVGTADPDGSGWDVDLALREWVSYLQPDPELRPGVADSFVGRAAAILREPGAWEAVERVAAALLQARRLDGQLARRLSTS